ERKSRLMKCLAVLFALCLSVTPTLAAPLGAAAPAKAPALIHAGDTLDIQVVGEAELSKSYTVSTGGTILVDMVGAVPVAGRTPDQVALELKTRLTRFLNRPTVMVAASASQSQEVTVMGEVLRPGAVKLRPGDGLLDAV